MSNYIFNTSWPWLWTPTPRLVTCDLQNNDFVPPHILMISACATHAKWVSCVNRSFYRVICDRFVEMSTILLMARNNSPSTANWHLWHMHWCTNTNSQTTDQQGHEMTLAVYRQAHKHSFTHWHCPWHINPIVLFHTHTQTPTHTCQDWPWHTLTESFCPLPTNVVSKTCQSRRSYMGFICYPIDIHNKLCMYLCDSSLGSRILDISDIC